MAILMHTYVSEAELGIFLACRDHVVHASRQIHRILVGNTLEELAQMVIISSGHQTSLTVLFLRLYLKLSHMISYILLFVVSLTRRIHEARHDVMGSLSRLQECVARLGQSSRSVVLLFMWNSIKYEYDEFWQWHVKHSRNGTTDLNRRNYLNPPQARTRVGSGHRSRDIIDENSA